MSLPSDGMTAIHAYTLAQGSVYDLFTGHNGLGRPPLKGGDFPIFSISYIPGLVHLFVDLTMDEISKPQQAAVAAIKIIVEQAFVAEMGDAQLRSKLDEVKELALQAGLAYEMQIPPSQVGIHPDNREGWGCSGRDSQALGSDIVGCGWSNAETSSATAFEDLPDRRGAKFTVKLQQSTNMLPQQSETSIRFLALACTHTNQFLVSVNQGIPTLHPNLAEHGHMSKSKIIGVCARMDEPLDRGLKWFVFNGGLWELVPKLPWLCQAAANKPGEIYRKASVFQALMGMQRDISEMKRSSVAIDDKIVLRNAAKKSRHLEDFPGLVAWAKVYGGGTSGFWVEEELCSFVKECCRSDAYVPGSIFKAIADWNRGPDDLCAASACAIIKMVAESNDPKFVMANKVTKVGKSADVKVVEQHLQQGRTCCTDHQGGWKAAVCVCVCRSVALSVSVGMSFKCSCPGTDRQTNRQTDRRPARERGRKRRGGGDR